MMNLSILKFLLPCLLAVGPVWAGGQEENRKEPDSAPQAQAVNRKAYEALYSEILKTLPRDGRIKVDSAHVSEAKTKPNETEISLTPEEAKKVMSEKRKRELDELPPSVKARVDKVISDLDNRRKEKEMEFKELK